MTDFQVVLLDDGLEREEQIRDYWFRRMRSFGAGLADFMYLIETGREEEPQNTVAKLTDMGCIEKATMQRRATVARREDGDCTIYSATWPEHKEYLRVHANS